MKSKGAVFSDKELAALYKLIKESHEKAPQTEEDAHFLYYDEYEPLVDITMLSALLKKVGNMLDNKEKSSVDKDFLRMRYHSYNNDVDEKAYAVLEKAFEQLKRVEIEYFNMESAEFVKREIDVYYKSRKYIIGYCHFRKDIRKFRTSRIASAKLTKEKYKIPKDFDKNDYYP